MSPRVSQGEVDEPRRAKRARLASRSRLGVVLLSGPGGFRRSSGSKLDFFEVRHKLID
jgi:hypothetical protein